MKRAPDEHALPPDSPPAMKIGVISDTHGYFDPAIPGLFAGVAHILHAGDVGPDSILLALERIAPVTAVLGNTDQFLMLNETELAALNGKKFLVHHIVNPHALDERLELRIARERPDAVIFGHTHKPFNEVIGDRLFVNPGYAGRTRFGLRRSVALLEWEAGPIATKFLPLD